PLVSRLRVSKLYTERLRMDDSRSVRIDIVMLRSIRFRFYSNRVITGPRYFCTNPSSTIARLKSGQDMHEQGLLATVNADKLGEVGGLDSLTLNSLYDEGAYRASQQPVYGSPAPNLFEAAGCCSRSMTLYHANPSSV
ncbi:hypothetical protein Tco_0093864, partial [Tanacetum coccineum]